MASVSGLERDRAVRRRGACVELARLRDRAARQLRAGDSRPGSRGSSRSAARSPPARRARCPRRRASRAPRRLRTPRRRARPGRRRRRPGRPPRAARARARSRARARPRPIDGPRSSPPPGSRTSGRLAFAARGAFVVPRVREGGCSAANSTIRIVASDECGPTISSPMPSTLLQRLTPRDERRQHEVAERPVLEQERAQGVALDRDVPQRLRHDRRHEDRLPGEQVHLAEEARRSVAQDLVACRVEDRDLTLEDRDERIRRGRRRGRARRRPARFARHPACRVARAAPPRALDGREEPPPPSLRECARAHESLAWDEAGPEARGETRSGQRRRKRCGGTSESAG